MSNSIVYFVDSNIIYQILQNNIWYLVKLLIMAYVVFYWVPVHIFPQTQTGKGIQKIIFNFVYMAAYIETVVPFLVFIKAFSIILFIFTLVLTKLIALKWYYKKDILTIFKNLKIDTMTWFFNLMDKTKELKTNTIKKVGLQIIQYYKTLTPYKMAHHILFFIVFFYILITLISRGLYSYSNPVSDTAQFIEWVDSLQKNILYADAKTFGADFYGISIMIFFVNLFTNIDVIILFSVYPVLLLLALYLSIFYVVKEFSDSKYVALFAVMVHGIILMSPLSNMILGSIVYTAHPSLVHFHNLSFYLPNLSDHTSISLKNGFFTYIRYVSGMAYEHSSVFVLLNAFFLIKTLDTHQNKYLLLYFLTLMLVFIFHGGGAIVLIIISIFVAINALLFGRINLTILKKGLYAIISAAILGNFWLLSMIKYGIPQNFGVAAPFLDKLFHTSHAKQNVAIMGTQVVTISSVTHIMMLFFIMLFFSFIYAFFTKNRFVNISYLLMILAIFILYFGPNIGMPMLVNQGRLSEYMFFAITLLLSFYYLYFFYKPILRIFKKYSSTIMLTISYIFFIALILIVPRWMDTKVFWKNINEIEYTSIPKIILKINKNNRPFSWTVVSYVQEYAKVINKGFHINTQKFLLKYNPNNKQLKIPTKKIYIFVENYPNAYKGMGEWYYRWREQIENDLKSWIAMYSANHSNIWVYYKTKTITVYEIDNSEYVKKIKKLKREKRLKGLKNELF